MKRKVSDLDYPPVRDYKKSRRDEPSSSPPHSCPLVDSTVLDVRNLLYDFIDDMTLDALAVCSKALNEEVTKTVRFRDGKLVRPVIFVSSLKSDMCNFVTRVLHFGHDALGASLNWTSCLIAFYNNEGILQEETLDLMVEYMSEDALETAVFTSMVKNNCHETFEVACKAFPSRTVVVDWHHVIARGARHATFLTMGIALDFVSQWHSKICRSGTVTSYNTCVGCKRTGHLQTFRKWRDFAFSWALEGGNMALMQFLYPKDRDSKFTPRVLYDLAFKSGNVEIVKYFQQQHPLPTNAVKLAAVLMKPDLLLYCLQSTFQAPIKICTIVAYKYDRVDILDAIRAKHYRDFAISDLEQAIGESAYDCIKWLMEKEHVQGQSIRALVHAARSSDRRILPLLLTPDVIGQLIPESARTYAIEEVVYSALRSEDSDWALRSLKDAGFPIPEKAWHAAAQYNRVEVLDYLCNERVPLPDLQLFLYEAMTAGNPEIFKKVEAALGRELSREEYPVLHLPSYNIKMVQYLLEKGIVPTETMVKRAILNGDIETLQFYAKYAPARAFTAEVLQIAMSVKEHTMACFEIVRKKIRDKSVRPPITSCRLLDDHPRPLRYLRQLERAGYLPTQALLGSAMRRGNLNLVKLLREVFNLDWPLTTIHRAAEKGHLSVLKYALENKCPFSLSSLIKSAVAGGNEFVVLYCAKKFSFKVPDILLEAYAKGDHSLVERIVLPARAWPQNFDFALVDPRSITALVHATALGLPLTQHALERAARTGALEAMKFIFSRVKIFDANITTAAVLGNHPRCLAFALANGAPLPPAWVVNTLSIAADTECYAILKEHLRKEAVDRTLGDENYDPILVDEQQ